MAVETATYLLENEGATKSLCAISSRLVDAISAVFSELLARKVDVSEWVLQQEPTCLGKLLQALLRAASLMGMFMKMQPPVNFTVGLFLPTFISGHLRSLLVMEEHNAWNWEELCDLVCAVRRALASQEQCRDCQ